MIEYPWISWKSQIETDVKKIRAFDTFDEEVRDIAVIDFRKGIVILGFMVGDELIEYERPLEQVKFITETIKRG